MTLEIDMLDSAEVTECIPVGRRAYVTAIMETGNRMLRKNAFGDQHMGTLTTYGIRRAIHALAEDNAAGILTPQLPEELGKVIAELSDEAKAEETKHGEGPTVQALRGASFFEHADIGPAAVLAIYATIDHGLINYKPEPVS